MTVQIVGAQSASARNGATSSALTDLQSYISSLSLGRDVIINGAGEALVPGSLEAWTPQRVADWVNSGNVWVDYCPWPMYYEAAADGAFTTLGDVGFQTFAQAVGYAWLDQTTFNVPALHIGRGGFRFARAYKAIGSQAGVYLATGTVDEGLGPQSLADYGYFALMALHAPRTQAPNAGIYVYASQSPFAVAIGSLSAANYVPPVTVAAFLEAAARGMSKAGGLTIAHAPYTAQTPATPPPGGGPTSPYPGAGSGSGVKVSGGFYILTEEMSANTLVAREGITLKALQGANPLSLELKTHPGALLKIGTKLKEPSTAPKSGGGSTGGGGSGGGGSGGGSSTNPPLPKWLEYAGIGAGAVAAGAGAIYGYRHIVQGRNQQ